MSIDLKKKLIKNTSVNYLSTFITAGLGFVLFPFILKNIGSELYGLYILIIAFSGYLSLMEGGVGTATVKFISQHLAKNEKKEINEIVINSLIYYIFIGFSIAVFLILIALFFIGFLKIPNEYLTLTKNTLFFTSILVFINWPLSLFRKVLEGKQRYTITSGLTAVFAIIRFLLIVLCLRRSNNVLLFLIIINFSVQILQNLIFAIYAFRNTDFLKLDFSLVSKKIFKKIFGFSWALFVLQICGIIVYNTDKIIISIFLPISSMVLYEACFRIHNFIRMVNGLASSAVIPAASSLNAKGNFAKLNELFFKGSKYATIIVLPLTITTIIFSKYIVEYWLGPEYSSIVFPMQLFISYWALNCSFALGGSVLVAIDKIKYMLWYSVGGAVGNLILSLILVSYMKNFVAVIWGTVIPYYIGYPIFLFFFLKLMKISFNEFFKKVISVTYSYAGVLVIISFLLLRIYQPHNLLETILYMSILIILYWGAIFFRGLQKDERKNIKIIALDIMGIGKNVAS